MTKQEQMIKLVKKRALAEQSIDSVLMYGSFTQGAGDKYSDIEFYVFVQDEGFACFDTSGWLSTIHPFYRNFLNEHLTQVVIFTNLIRGEFHFLPLSEISVIDSFTPAGYFPDIKAMNLCDKNGKLAKQLTILKDCHVNRQTKENAANIIDNLLNYILFGVNVLKRGELARALECLGAAQKLYIQAVRLQEGSTDHWLNPSKNLEEEISPACYETYKACTAVLTHESIFSAYTNLIKASEASIRVMEKKYEVGDYSTLVEHILSYHNNLCE